MQAWVALVPDVTMMSTLSFSNVFAILDKGTLVSGRPLLRADSRS